MMKQKILLLLAGLVCAAVFAGCAGGQTSSSEANPSSSGASETASSDASAPGEEPAQENMVKIVVGASPTPHAEILAVCKEILLEQNIDLQIKEFTDYIQPNLALEQKELDANYFQHQPYLDDFNVNNGTHLASVSAPHYEPFGIYPGKTKSLEELADGASVAVPNDTTNEARALLLLEANGLIKLKEGAGLSATKQDIAENPKNLDIKEIEAAQLPRSIQDVDIAAINGNYAVQAGLHADKDALAVEQSDSESAKTYANVIAIREGDESRPELKALAEAASSQKVKDFITEKYEGAVIPMD